MGIQLARHALHHLLLLLLLLLVSRLHHPLTLLVWVHVLCLLGMLCLLGVLCLLTMLGL